VSCGGGITMQGVSINSSVHTIFSRRKFTGVALDTTKEVATITLPMTKIVMENFQKRLHQRINNKKRHFTDIYFI